MPGEMSMPLEVAIQRVPILMIKSGWELTNT
jgi:hypothetical protein